MTASGVAQGGVNYPRYAVFDADIDDQLSGPMYSCEAENWISEACSEGDGRSLVIRMVGTAWPQGEC